MSLILAIETALDVCSVAVSRSGKSLAVKEEIGHNIHASRLNVFVQEAVKEAGERLKDIQAVCVSMGPGSYTGLRIGVSAAKGLCFGLDVPLISINTLSGMAAGAISKELRTEALYCPMIDARRMEVYYGLYSSRGEVVKDTAAAIIDEDFVSALPQGKEIIFFGNGMPKCREVLSQYKGASFIEDINPSAAYFSRLAFEKYGSGDFENIDTFEPFYLKDFIAGKPAKKLL